MVGIDLRTLTYFECVQLVKDIKASMSNCNDAVIFRQLRHNLTVVENYIVRTYTGRRNPSGPPSIIESRWS